ncbi:MAG: Amino acid/amide transporter rane protein 2, family [Bradyrhizobium sp.]|jgi:branched-chain amino acid transport system permease protein|nr:Amino acid/amide transporter rane protein 2, family [Bradyrhizobium sp.]MEA2866770.1 branched-chain amino acid transport system permease protein [Bradyrhizobium sp.]
MSGYATQITAILIVNIVAAYSAYMPLACGQLNLGTAGFMAIGAYTSAVLSSMNWPLSLAIAGGVCVSTMAGFVISFPVLRARGIYLTIATLAFSEVVAAILLNLNAVGAASGFVVSNHIDVQTMFWTMMIVLAAVACLSSTRFGLCMTAVRNDGRGAAVFGVGVRRIEVASLTIGAGFAGVAGALYAHHFNYIEAQHFNVLLSTYAVLYALLGGLQTPLGPLIGAIVFTLVPELLRSTDQWRYVGFGVCIVLLMLLRPEGLLTRRLIRDLPFRRRYA